MDVIIEATRRTVQYVLGSPHTLQNHGILGALALLSALFLFGRMAKLTDMDRTTPGMVVLGVLIGFALTLAVMVVADHFIIAPYLPGYRAGALVGASLLGALLVSVPVLSFVHRGSYGGAAFSWCTALAVASFVVIIARTGMDAYESGERQGAKVRARAEEIESFLESK